MEGLPLIPGFAPATPYREKHHVPHHFEYKNGYQVCKIPHKGIGEEPLDADSIRYHRSSIDPIRLHTSLMYGRTKIWNPPVFKPHFVLYDKKCLSFEGFCKLNLPGSPSEPFRIRKVKVIYFLEDDTITISEPKIMNAGYPQGKLVARSKIPKDTEGNFLHWKDLNVGININVYGVIYRLCSCDLFTKEFMLSQGIELNNEEELPEDPYTSQRETQISSFSSDSDNNAADEKLRKFIMYDGKVLRFYALFDNRDAEEGQLVPHIIHYYLADDTVEVVQEKKGVDGQDPHYTIMKRMKVPRDWKAIPGNFPACYLEKSDSELLETYQAKDFTIGKTVQLLGRRFLIYDCDGFTRNFYKHSLGIEQGPRLNIEEDKDLQPKQTRPLPQYIGLGSVEDSIQSWFTYRPEHPKTDVVRYLHNLGKKLRYTAVMDYIHPEDAKRKFLIEYRLSDGCMSVNEEKIQNLGYRGGRFLKFMLVPKPGTDPRNPEYYTPADFNIGSVVNVFGHKFIITAADLAVYRYMEANPDKFRAEVVSEVRKSLMREGHLREDVRDISDYHMNEATNLPVIDPYKEMPPSSHLHVPHRVDPTHNPECLIRNDD